MFATVEDFEALQPAYEDVPAPELGEGKTVRVRVMSALTKDRWELSNFRMENGAAIPFFEGSRARLVAAACCHEDFSPLFTAQHIEMLNEKRSDLIDRLYDAAERLNGINAGVELAKKVFAAVRSGGSSTESPTNSGTPLSIG